MSVAPEGFRTPPHNLEAEHALLGAILINNEAWHRVADVVRPEHFYEPVHARIFEVMAQRIRAGRVADHVLIQDLFAEDGTLREIEGGAKRYLEAIVYGGTSIESARDYAELVHNLAVRRGQARVGEEIINLAYNGADDPLGSAKRLFEQLESEAAGQPAGRKGSETMPESTTWLWHPYFATGELSLIGARGGVGKGQAAASIVARLTAGAAWPDGAEGHIAGHVLWADAEDSITKTVVPRLIANRADLELVTFFDEEEFAALDLRRFIDRNHTRAVVLNPITSFLPKLRSHIDELAVRAELHKLRTAVGDTECALIGIAHLNKKADLDAIERLLGSVAFVNFVRSVVLLAPDKERPELRRWVHAKYNLSIKGNDLLFRTVHVGEDHRDQFVRCDWEPAGADVEVESFFERRQPKGGKPSAGEWLVAYLEEHGESLRADIVIAGEKEGYSEAALKQAQIRNPRIRSRQDGFQGPYLWALDR